MEDLKHRDVVKNGTEEHRWIEGYEGSYSITPTGRVYSHSRLTGGSRPRMRKGKWLKSGLNGKGYHRVTLYSDGKGSDKEVHRLIAIAYLPTDDRSLWVCHKDDVRINNSLDNLYWGTASDNAKDRIANGYVPTAETLAKRSKALKGLKRTDETKARMSKAAVIRQTGKIPTDETRAKMSKSHKERYAKLRLQNPV